MKETPLLIKSPSGLIQPSPLLGIANKQLELMQKFMAEVGLSPASQSRVSTHPSLAPKPSKFRPGVGRRQSRTRRILRRLEAAVGEAVVTLHDPGLAI